MSEHPDEDDYPLLPYAGTSGFAQGSDTSEEAVRERDESGVTGFQERRTMKMLDKRLDYGMTTLELSEIFNVGMNIGAPILSRLHLRGKVVRLKQRRGGKYEVYVLPEYVYGREVSPRGHHGATRLRVLEAELKEFRRRAREAKAANEWTPTFTDGFTAAISLLELHRDIARGEEDE